jgi:hypothetical protein
MTGRRQLGFAVAAVGSASLIASLWEPWYGFRIPGLIIHNAEQVARRFGMLEPVVRRAAEVARQAGGLHVNSWQLLTTSPAVLLVIGVVAGGLAVLAFAGRTTGVAGFVVGAAAIGVAVALYRFLKPPGPHGLLAPAWGIELALGSAVAVLAGGLLASTAERAKPDAFVARTIALSETQEPAGWPSPGSVAPPST